MDVQECVGEPRAKHAADKKPTTNHRSFYVVRGVQGSKNTDPTQNRSPPADNLRTMGDHPPQLAPADAPAAVTLTQAQALAQLLAIPNPLTVPYATPEIVNALDAAARRGKLAGFEPGAPGTAYLFRAEAFGTPFEGWLLAHATLTPTTAGGGPSTTLTYSRRLKPLWPWTFALVLLLSVWPGVLLTESLLAAMLPNWSWLWKTTWYWYLPLSTLGGIAAMHQALKRSRLTIAASAHEAAETIKSLLHRP